MFIFVNFIYSTTGGHLTFFQMSPLCVHSKYEDRHLTRRYGRIRYRFPMVRRLGDYEKRMV